MTTTTADRLATALNRVERARADLAEATTEGVRSEQLARYLNTLAEAEGRLTVAHAISNWEAAEPDTLTERLTELLLRGADDSWSGRTNDTRRAYFDGVRAAIDDYRRGWGW